MTTFKEIQGRNIRSYTTNPDNPLEGQMWYNQTELKLKGVAAGGAWASGSPTSSQHGDGNGCGEQTATVIWGGYSPDNPQITNSTEEYNGSGWTTGGNYPTTTIGSGSAGVLTAALGISGRTGPGGNTNVVNNYDGSSWTATTNYPASNYGTIGFGSQTAAVGLGGNPRADAAPSGVVNSTFDWNGSAWTASGNYPSTISNAGGTGSQTAGITAGGYNSAGTNQTFSATYDGSTWTLGPNINRPADQNMAQAGNQTSSLIYGGGTNAVKTESWDGSAWSNQPDLAGVGGYGGQMGATNNSSGSSKGLLAATREGSNYPVATEEYNFTANTITAAAWSSGGNLNNARYSFAGAGTQTAALAFGSETSVPSSGGNDSESYNGTSWTATPDIQTARDQLAGAGTQTAALAFAGYTGSLSTASEEWNGSSWSEGNNLSTARRALAGAGLQTAALAIAGYTPPSNSNATEEYGGTSWTAGGNLSTARRSLGASGTQTAGLAFAGYTSTQVTNTEEYGGTSWTAGGSLLTARASIFGMGTQTAALASGGTTPSLTAATEAYDGTSWSTRPNMATARGNGASAINSSTTAGLIFGGDTGTSINNTEEFTVPVGTANITST